MRRQIIRFGFLTVVLAGCVISQQPQAERETTQTNQSALATATDIPLPVLATNTRIPTSTPAVPDVPPIVFESSRSGAYNLYAMYPDGSGVQQLTQSDVASRQSNGSPAWSPDGRQIAFSGLRDGDWDIHIIAADGAFQSNLTAETGEDDKASWSPDGAWIAFNSRRGARWHDIWIMNADGSAPVNLTRHPDDDREPSWSPNGMEIAFRSFRDGNYEIYIMDVESRAVRQLTRTDQQAAGGGDVWNGSPVWSPDGARIAFETNRDGNWNVYVMDNNGSNIRNLTPHSADDHEPTWSPDGRFLAFTSNRDGNDEIYRLEIGTGSIVRLTYDCAGDNNPDWRRVGAAAGNGEPARTAVAYVARNAPINLRTGPGMSYESGRSAALNECLTVIGRSDDGMWLQVRTSLRDRAWVARSLVDVQGDLANVPVIAE